jgi:hypothetical protein
VAAGTHRPGLRGVRRLLLLAGTLPPGVTGKLEDVNDVLTAVLAVVVAAGAALAWSRGSGARPRSSPSTQSVRLFPP